MPGQSTATSGKGYNLEQDESAREAIEHLVTAMVSTWNRHDARGYAAIFAEDVDFTNVFGVLMHGRAAIETSHAVIFETMFKHSSLTVAETSIRLLRPDIAAVDVRWRMTGARDPKGEAWPERHGLLSAIAMELSDCWSFVVFHNQDLPPPEQVAAFASRLPR
jgi:uncharacterized protein (TIGR02246 family)